MSDHPPTTETSDSIDSLELRLDAWGQRERSGVAEPAPKFMRAVRAARGPRLVARLAGAMALAAVLALVAYVAFRPAPSLSPIISPDSTTLFQPPARAFTAGVGRNADVADVFGLLDAMPQPTGPSAPAPRASDAYCAGCLEELTRL